MGSERTAITRLKEIKEALSKTRVNIYDLVIYEGYPPEVVKDYLDG